MSSRGIRGSSIDRGRGRARGGLYHSALGNYQRTGFAYDEESRGTAGARVIIRWNFISVEKFNSSSFLTHSQGERAWTDRNGTVGEPEWNAMSNPNPSPRKEFTTVRGGNTSGESWRRSRVEDEGKISAAMD